VKVLLESSILITKRSKSYDWERVDSYGELFGGGTGDYNTFEDAVAAALLEVTG